MNIAILYAVWPYIAAVLVLGVAGQKLLLKRRLIDAGGPPSSAPIRRARRVVGILLTLAVAAGIVMPGAVFGLNAVAGQVYTLERLALVVGLSTVAACAAAAWHAFAD